MMVKVYGIPNCNTVKKAIDWLQAHGIEYMFHNYKKEGVPKDHLKRWTKYFGWEIVVNKKGTTWRGFHLKCRRTSKTKARRLH